VCVCVRDSVCVCVRDRVCVCVRDSMWIALSSFVGLFCGSLLWVSLCVHRSRLYVSVETYKYVYTQIDTVCVCVRDSVCVCVCDSVLIALGFGV